MKPTQLSLVAIAILITLGSLTTLMPRLECEANDQGDITQTLLVGIEAREASITSAMGYVVYESYSNSAFPGIETMSEKTRLSLQKSPLLSEYFWAVDKEKVREDYKILTSQEERLRPADGTTPPDNLVVPQAVMNASDGNRTQQWNVGFPNAKEWVGGREKGASFSALSIPAQLPIGHDAGLWSLSKQLKVRHAHFTGKELIGGVEAYKMESVNPDEDFTETWWIAPSRSYILLKRELRSTPEVSSRYSLKRDVSVVDKLHKIADGLWMPSITRSVSFATLKVSNQEAWVTVEQYSFLMFKVNQSIPSQFFDLPLPPGTRVFPDEGGQSYVLPGDKQAFEIKLAEAKTRGEQPDMESIDVSPFKARITKNQPIPKQLLDIPAQSLVDDG